MSIKVIVGNIQELTGVEAIVNAANPQLRNGAGVCGAIFRAAGEQELTEACDKLPVDPKRGLTIGSVRRTGAFNLEKNGIKHILHAVGPDFRIPEQEAVGPALLLGTYENIFRVARANGIKSVAIPAISAGIYGCPIAIAAKVAVLSANLQEKMSELSLLPEIDITFVVWEENRPYFEDALKLANL
jgi:O-acetyl-ADP-ribose deacetylase